MNTKEILNMVENKKISVDEAVVLIKKNKTEDGFLENQMLDFQNSKSKGIKIKIIDGENGKKINLPTIPISLAGKLVSLAIKINNRNGMDYINKISGRDIKQIFNTLKNLPPAKLILIEETNGTFVEIYTK